ncbi:hypothetical protein JI664_22390 [Rhodobacter sp. NTK016B]|uniref:hypothetical protein n=1 Tax=Rhodobacter sp. NTK016B TaxID=2759676 RepID=UPI001A8D2BEF|nr:hypothetical protein [Rhodobacter sp. NTK016B]MBN8294736.1 hypothetical protein [Rhodobacter sp. NTK016B]
MLKIIKNPEFTAKVKVRMPVEGGAQDTQFTARFKGLTVSETAAFDTVTVEGTNSYLRAILVGWGEDLRDEAGEPMSFNDANRDMLIDIGPIRVALLQAYNLAMMGAKQGN